MPAATEPTVLFPFSELKLCDAEVNGAYYLSREAELLL
jgi:hypothetical protein